MIRYRFELCKNCNNERRVRYVTGEDREEREEMCQHCLLRTEKVATLKEHRKVLNDVYSVIEEWKRRRSTR